MSQENNFIPNQENYKPLTPFQLFVKSNFPFIENTFEALDNYGLYCKIVEYLNTVIANENTVESNVGALYDAFVSLNTYVSDYFDNLDVQEEINNKLDDFAEDGTLERIINEHVLSAINNAILQNTIDIASNRNALENKISQNQANSITMDMLTNDVKSAMTGGSTAIVGENSIDYVNIKNNGVDLLNLTADLQSNLLKKFQPITLQNPSTGYWYNNNGTPTLENNQNYRYYTIPLTKGKIYKSLSYNSYFASGLMVLDNSNNIILASNYTNEDSQYMKGLYFRANKNNLTAYVSIPISWTSASLYIRLANIVSSLSVLSDTEIFLKDYEKKNLVSIDSILTYDNSYINIQKKVDANSGFVFPQVFVSDTPSNYKFKMFYLQKGQTIKVKCYNAYNMCGLVITDINGSITYMSSEASTSDFEEVNREFLVPDDCYMYVSYNINYLPTIETYTPFSEINNNLISKSLYGDGDSIAYGYGNNGESYLDMIASNNSMTLTKKAISGTTIAKRENHSDSILERVQASANNNENYDYIVIEGGINDVFQSVPIGEISSGLNATLNEYTFSGALESLCKTLVTSFSSSKFCFLLTNKKVNQYMDSQQTYWNRAREILEKWSIPYIDLSKDSGCLPINNNLLNRYFFIPTGATVGDGTHPNELGYKTFFVDKITSFINLL